MVSLGMLIARPLSMAVRSAGLLAGSAPLLRAATEISRMILVNILPRLASDAFLRASIEGPRPMEISGPAGKPAILLEAGPPGLRAPRGADPVGTLWERPWPRCLWARTRSIAAMAAPTGSSTGSAPEAALAQERARLRDRLGREQQPAVAGLDHHVVRQPRAPGFLDRHGAVVVAVELRQQAAQPVREAAGDHAD